MKVTLNLATRPYNDIRPALKRLRIAMAVLAVVAIGLGFGLRAFHQKAELARATEQKVQSRIDAINRERIGYQSLMQQPANKQLLTQAGELNQLFDEKTFSWTLAMEDLETVLPGGVQVTAIDPERDTKTGKITLKLRVVGPRNKADDLVQNLEHSRYFLSPHIVSESTESNGGPNERLEPVSASNRFTFELLADYNAAVPLEHHAHGKAAKPSAEGESLRQSAPPLRAVRPPGPSAAPGPGLVRPGFMPPNRPQPNANPVFNRNPNRNSIPNPNTNTGGPR
jgi:type IV pilus assembly protein PilN